MNVEMTAGKGMSQTLALIVAASVLMMTALTVIFLTQGSLGELGSKTTQDACTSALEGACQTTWNARGVSSGTITVSFPDACRDANGQPLVSGSYSSGWVDSVSPASNEVTCSPP